MRNRNELGQFRPNQRIVLYQEFLLLFELIAAFIKLLPILLLAYFVYRHFNISSLIYHSIEKELCGLTALAFVQQRMDFN